jgi:hypothetical protein
MGIELLIAIVVLGGVAVWYFNRSAKSFDLNSDGKTDVADAKVAVENAVTGVKAVADVNNDGNLDSADVKVVAEKAKKTAKKAVGKAKAATATVTTAKKPRPKKQ